MTLFAARQISKAFAAPVLKSINFTVNPGEVVALTGENGAGKSTLSKIVAGLIAADSGEMQLDGERYAPPDRTAAERLGVRMVLQELSLVATLSIAENLQLGRIPARAGFIRRAEMHRIGRAQLERVGLTGVDLAAPIGELGIGQQQLVEIARGLMGEVKLLILDEPTAMLTAPEIVRLFEQIERLKSQGVGIVYISHRLDELRRIADRVVVLRDGQWVCDRPMREVEHDEIVRAMVGREMVRDDNRPRRTSGAEKLRVENFSRADCVRDVSLAVHAGEILGVAGLVGSGRTELLRLIFGADKKDSGQIYLDGAPLNIASPSGAVAQGIGLLTEDRKAQGLLLPQPIEANLTLADLSAVSRRGWISAGQESQASATWMSRLAIRANNGKQAVEELSGGNQQKVLLGRWLHRSCRVLLLDEPTRGIDIGARADIYAELDVLAKSGKALLVVSSDLRELMELCDRIAVMSAGRLVKIFERGEWSEEALLAAAFAAYSGESQHAAAVN